MYSTKSTNQTFFSLSKTELQRGFCNIFYPQRSADLIKCCNILLHLRYAQRLFGHLAPTCSSICFHISCHIIDVQ